MNYRVKAEARREGKSFGEGGDVLVGIGGKKTP